MRSKIGTKELIALSITLVVLYFFTLLPGINPIRDLDPLNNPSIIQLAEVDGLKVFGTKGIELTSDENKYLNIFLNNLPEFYRKNNTKKILIFETDNMPHILEQVSNSGGFVLNSNTIFINRLVISSDWSLTHTILHEYMHHIQNLKNPDSVINLYSTAVNAEVRGNSFMQDYLHSVGWEFIASDPMNIYFAPGTSKSFSMNSDYGKNNTAEDMAETAAYFYTGQYHLLSPERINWMEKLDGHSADSYSNCVFPFQSFNIYSLSKSEFTNRIDKGTTTLTNKDLLFINELESKYMNVSITINAYPNDKIFLNKEFLAQLEKRGFSTPFKAQNSSNYEFFKTSCDEGEAYYGYYGKDSDNSLYSLIIEANTSKVTNQSNTDNVVLDVKNEMQ